MKLTLIDNLGRQVTQPASFPAAGAPTTASYITQTPDASLGNEQALSLLSGGFLFHTAGGVLGIGTLANRAMPYFCLKDRKASGVDGGASVAGTWSPRDLNSEDADTNGIVTVSGNQFVFSVSGSMAFRISAPARAVGRHQIRLYNVTDAAVVQNLSGVACLGTSEDAQTTVQNRSELIDVCAVIAGKSYRVEHRCTSTTAGSGFGFSTGFGTGEIYTVVQGWQVG